VRFEDADIAGPVLADLFGSTCIADRLVAESAMMARVGYRELLLAPVAMIGLFEPLSVRTRFDSVSILKPKAAIQVS